MHDEEALSSLLAGLRALPFAREAEAARLEKEKVSGNEELEIWPAISTFHTMSHSVECRKARPWLTFTALKKRKSKDNDGFYGC